MIHNQNILSIFLWMQNTDCLNTPTICVYFFSYFTFKYDVLRLNQFIFFLYCLEFPCREGVLKQPTTKLQAIVNSEDDSSANA